MFKNRFSVFDIIVIYIFYTIGTILGSYLLGS